MSRRGTRGVRYSVGEIRNLVERYEALVELVDTDSVGLRALASVLDIRMGVRSLPVGQRHVVLLHGVLGLAPADAGRALQISERAVYKRYADALAHMQWTLNGR